jgi:starvation-inducible DNA-binding protein
MALPAALAFGGAVRLAPDHDAIARTNLPFLLPLYLGRRFRIAPTIEASKAFDLQSRRRQPPARIEQSRSIANAKERLQKMTLHKTRNDLTSNTKTALIALLNARLAEAIDLALMTKQAHWNLRGRTFIAVHEMLDSFRAEIDVHADTLAERAVQLGGVAIGTSQTVGRDSSLKAYPTDLVNVDDHVVALGDRYGDLANATRAAIDAAAEAGDADTADIFTAFSRSLDKALWFLEASQEPET